jgi:hypothetical protein
VGGYGNVRTDGVHEDAGNITVSHTERQDPETIHLVLIGEVHIQSTDRTIFSASPRFVAVLGRNASNYQHRTFVVDSLQCKICITASDVVFVPIVKENSPFPETLLHSGRDRPDKIALFASERERD